MTSRIVPWMLGLITAWLALHLLPRQWLSLSTRDPSGDEALLYRVRTERPLRMEVPAGTDEVELHLVALVPESDVGPVRRRFSFTVHAELQVADRNVDEWDVALRSRVSREAPPGNRRGTRFRQSELTGTDARVVVIPTRGLAPRVPATLILRPRPGKYDEVLVRAFARRADAADPARVFEVRNVNEQKQVRLGALGSALGYSDIPASLLERALANRGTRINAIGERGTDYEAVRATLYDYRRPLRLSAHPTSGPPIPVDPRFRIALNVAGPLRLILRGKPGFRYRVASRLLEDEAAMKWSSARLPPAGVAELLTVGKESPLAPEARSVVLGFERAGRVRLETDAQGAAALLGDPGLVRPRGNDRWSIRPDVRSGLFYRLNWRKKRPNARTGRSGEVVFRVESDQKALRLVARSEIRSGTSPSDGVVRLRYRMRRRGAEDVVGRVEHRAPQSKFEHLIGPRPVSEAFVVPLELPSGVTRVSISGDANTLVRAFVRDPSVDQDHWAHAYRRSPPVKWHYAPRSLRQWVPIHPLKADNLARFGRVEEVMEQVRVVSSAPTPEPDLVEPPPVRPARLRRVVRAVRPAKPLPSDRVLETKARPGGERHAWSDVTEGGEVRVRRQGMRELLLRVPREGLGRPIEVWVDGNHVSEVVPRTTLFVTRVPLLPGLHRVEIRGLARVGGSALIAAVPVRGPTLRLRTLARVSPQVAARYRFSSRPGERQELSLRVISRGSLDTIGLNYELISQMRDTGQPETQVARRQLRMRPTDVRFIDGSGGDQSVRAAGVTFRLPVAVAGADRRVQLRFDSADPVWVHADLITTRIGSRRKR